MEVLKNKHTARTILILCAAFCILFGSWRTLHGMYSSAEQTFYNGQYNDGIGVASDLSARKNAAVNLMTIARKYMSGNDTVLTQVDTAIAAIDDADTINELYDANTTLNSAFYQLVSAVDTCDLSESDANYRQNLEAEFASRASTMSHDAYNEEAQEYNQTLNSMPAGLFAKLFGLTSLELFR